MAVTVDKCCELWKQESKWANTTDLRFIVSAEKGAEKSHTSCKRIIEAETRGNETNNSSAMFNGNAMFKWKMQCSMENAMFNGKYLGRKQGRTSQRILTAVPNCLPARVRFPIWGWFQVSSYDNK